MTRGLCITLTALLLVACGSSEQTYATLREARSDHLFERGWLPDVLPPSTVDITIRTNLDLNTATGSFRFSSSEGGAFSAATRVGGDERSWPSEWREFASRSRATGSRASIYSRGSSHWLFLCVDSAGYTRCTWTSRSDG
jgi:hypothetical protein